MCSVLIARAVVLSVVILSSILLFSMLSVVYTDCVTILSVVMLNRAILIVFVLNVANLSYNIPSVIRLFRKSV